MEISRLLPKLFAQQINSSIEELCLNVPVEDLPDCKFNLFNKLHFPLEAFR